MSLCDMVSVPLRPEPGSSVSIVTRLQAGQPENLGLIPGEGRDLSLPGWLLAHPLTSYQMEWNIYNFRE
jgi:hypothetical protein